MKYEICFEVYNQYDVDELNKKFNFTISSINILATHINISIIAQDNINEIIDNLRLLNGFKLRSKSYYK